MTIYILDNDPKLISEALDDKSLDEMIRDIAKVLCQVHCSLVNTGYWATDADDSWDIQKKIFGFKKAITITNDIEKWSNWARECKANYLYLVELGYALGKELMHREITKSNYKARMAIQWTNDNVPDLPEITIKVSSNHRIGFGERKDGNIVELRELEIPEAQFSHECTPFPLIMPKKYLLGVTETSKTNQSINDSHNRWSILSYRNYYLAKLKKRIEQYKEWQSDVSTIGVSGCGEVHVQAFEEANWTKRCKPKWVII